MSLVKLALFGPALMLNQAKIFKPSVPKATIKFSLPKPTEPKSLVSAAARRVSNEIKLPSTKAPTL